MTTKKLAQSYLDLETELKKHLQFITCGANTGSCQAAYRESRIIFLDGLMRQSKKKSNAFRITEGLNAAALYGFVAISGATNMVKAMTLIYSKLTDDPIEICESAASFVLLACNSPEFESIDSNSHIFFRLARVERHFIQAMYKHLEVARRV